jgi:hypothetical protein
MYIGYWWEIDHLEDQDVGEWVILKCKHYRPLMVAVQGPDGARPSYIQY